MLLTLPEILRLVHNLVRLGTIAERDLDAARCRVAIGELTTDWLPWLAGRAGDARTWDPPDVGEQVIVLSAGGDHAAGIVLFGLYRNAAPPPANEAGVWLREFSDGAVIRYDSNAHELKATIPGKAEISAENAMITATTLITGTTTIKGNTSIEGNLSVQGSVSFTDGSVQHDGKNIGATHKHPGVQSGAAQTGVPV